MRVLTKFAVICVVTTIAVSAASVWDEKPFTEWSDKDVEKILTDSPWAGKASITHEKAGADLGPVPDWKLIVAVRSAGPIRQALARKQLLAGASASPELEANLAIPHPRYAFTIAQIPQFYGTQLTKSAQIAVMKLKGKSHNATAASVSYFDKNGNSVQPPAPRGRPQASAGVQIVPIAQRGGGGGFGGGPGGGFGGGVGGGVGADNGNTATLMLEFPRGEGVSDRDGEVELTTVIGNYGVKKTFKLKGMVAKGTLAF